MITETALKRRNPNNALGIIYSSLDCIVPTASLSPKEAECLREKVLRELRGLFEVCGLDSSALDMGSLAKQYRKLKPDRIIELTEVILRATEDKHDRISGELRGIAIQLETVYGKKEERDYTGFKMPEIIIE